MILHAPYPVDGLKVVDGVSSLPLLSSDGRQQYTPLIKMQHMPAGLGYQALAGRSRFKGKGNFQSTICPKTGKLLAKEKAKAARRKAPPASKENKEVCPAELEEEQQCLSANTLTSACKKQFQIPELN